MTEVRLFTPEAPRVFTIPPGAAFLKVLAETLVEATSARDNPDVLADATIFVPNRRSASALGVAIYEAIGADTFLPPDIRPLGDIENGSTWTGVGEALASLGPPLSEATRIGTLASLVMKFYESRGGLPPSSALSAARELARLLDQAALSGGTDWSSLNDLVTQADLADHWQDSVRFLDIVRKAWPDWLEAQGAMDPFARRIAAAEALAGHWQTNPPKGPLIIAGSTGATPDTRVLMQAVIRLETGCIALPGLDPNMTLSEIRQSPSHSQYALAGTMEALNLLPTDIPVWPGSDETEQTTSRRRLMHEALAPAAATADWISRLDKLSPGESKEAFTIKALDGLTLLDVEDEAEEARCIALLMRDVLETKKQTAALVTPDAELSRRTSALLKRWGVDVALSGGTPILQTPTGSLIALALNWVLDPGDPVAICALLKHKLTIFDPIDTQILERTILRGPRRWTELTDLIGHIKKRAEKEVGSRHSVLTPETVEAASRIVTSLQEKLGAAHDVFAGQASITGPDGAKALAILATSLTDGVSLWSGADGSAVGLLLENFAELTKPLGPLPKHTLPGLLETIGIDHNVHLSSPDHPRLAIWGNLEARLQSADLIILAGLDEGIWPARPAAEAFLPRRFRAALGMDDPEALLGLSAHDFAQLACSPNVVLLTTRRRGDAPTAISRWIWRLRTLVTGALGPSEAAHVLAPKPEADPRPWANALTQPTPLASDFTSEPRPAPPVEARPKRLSVTRIDTLQRDPYAIYAEQVLRLNKLDPMNAELYARGRGTAIHAALESYEETGEEKSEPHLLALLESELLDAGEKSEVLAAMRAINRRTITWYLDEWRASHMETIQGVSKLEVRGSLTFEIGGQDFTLSAMADRVDKLKTGGLMITDYKTGNPPSDKEIAVQLSQQMPLQAMIARRGGFDGISADEVARLTYVSFKTNPKAHNVGDTQTLLDTPTELIEKAQSGLFRLIEAYADPARIYLSAPMAQFINYKSDYHLLARRAEWGRDTIDE